MAGTNQTYGGYVWSDQRAVEHRSTSGQMLKLAVAGGAVGIAGYAATRTMGDATRPGIDTLSAMVGMGGNLSPFQILNTFRFPEFADPLTSVKAQGLSDLGDGKWGLEIGAEFLEDRSTFDYLQKLTGMDASGLEKAGITPKMGYGSDLASKLVFERSAGNARGSLFSVTEGGQRHLLSDAVSSMAMSSDVDLITREKGISKAVTSVFQAMDLFGERFDQYGVFRNEGVRRGRREGARGADKQALRPKHLFVPSVTGPMDTGGDLLRRSTHARAVLAFEASRFNELSSGVLHQALGPNAGEVMARGLGVSTKVARGPATSMMMRYAGRAGAIGGGMLALQQADWIRRRTGGAGHYGVSLGLAAGVGAIGAKLGMKSRNAWILAGGAFAGQMLLPGMDKGVWAGIQTTAAKANVIRGNALNPFNYQRRTLEGFAPGISSWQTGALLAVGGALAIAAPLPGGKRLPDLILDTFGADKLGLAGVESLPQTTREIFWNSVHRSMRGQHDVHGGRAIRDMDPNTLNGRIRIAMAKREGFDTLASYGRWMNETWSTAENQFRDRRATNQVNESLVQRLEKIRRTAETGGDGLVSKLNMEFQGAATTWWHTLFGADPTYSQEILGKVAGETGVTNLGRSGIGAAIKEMGYMGLPGRLGRFGTVAAGIFAVHMVATGGLLGSMESSDELKAIYAGSKMVAVKDSRWWEAGGTPFSGMGTEYYRPHAYALSMNRVRERGIWGEDEDKISPLGKFVRKNFTYDLERRTYYDRPYPMSNAAFADLPILGGVLSATVGRLIKPAKVMHAGEWIRLAGQGRPEYASVYEGAGREPAYALGARGPGIPQSRYSPMYQASYFSYQFRELEGMTGWAKNTVMKMITGAPTFGSDAPVLADSGMMTSPRRMFWEQNLGGMLFSNELIRRVLPAYRSEFERTNPITNRMPSWLPERFHYGDPYMAVEWGEARLPGQGFAAMHPELRDVDGENYPLVFQYQILQDVAPHSRELQKVREQLYNRRASGRTSERENQYMDYIDTITREKLNVKDFDRLPEGAIALPGSGVSRAMWFGAQKMLRQTVAPLEYMTPMGFRPAQKLMGDNRDLIEQYEYERAYGTRMAFWDKPWRDWFRPAVYSAANFMGYEGKPMWRQDADTNAEYFDKLEFAKWMGLAEQAGMSGDAAAKRQYLKKASRTRAGVNPQGSPLGIYWSLPDSERKFFNAFAHADRSDRTRILEMVPEDQKHLYRSVWSRLDEGDPSMFHGPPIQHDQEYMANQFASLGGYFQDQPMPSQDWIGWHEDVDMEDIRVRYVDELGKDLHDYGMWESQLKKSMQQPFLEGSTQQLHQGRGGRAGAYSALHRQLQGTYNSPWLSVHSGGGQTHGQLTYNDNREVEILAALERYNGTY